MPKATISAPRDFLVNLTAHEFDEDCCVLKPRNVNTSDYTHLDDPSYGIITFQDPLVEGMILHDVQSCIRNNASQGACSRTARLVAALCAVHQPTSSCGFLFHLPGWFSPYIEIAFLEHPSPLDFFHFVEQTPSLSEETRKFLAIPGIVKEIYS